MDNTENHKLQLQFAEIVYANGLSFNAMSGDRWNKFFKQLRPSFNPPSRKSLSGNLLDESFENNNKKAQVYLEKSDYISLIIDGWTNVRRDAIINIVAMTPKPVFLKSIDTEGASKTADYMFEALEKVITERDPKLVTGLISDNEQKMISLSKLVQAKYPYIIFSGCVGHKLSNMIKKICLIPSLQKLVTGTKDIIIEMRNSDKLLAKYRELCGSDKEKKYEALKLYSDTRFAGSILMIKTFIKAIEPLRTIAVDPSLGLSQLSKKKLLSLDEYNSFYSDLTKLQSICQPACDTIHILEADVCTIADTIDHMQKHEQTFSQNL